MKSSFDITKVIVYIASLGGVITIAALYPILHPWGVSDAMIATVTARIASVIAASLLITMLINAFKNPTPPSGTVSAVIPKGSVPVVTAAPGTGTQSVAIASPETVLQVTPANQTPPPQSKGQP